MLTVSQLARQGAVAAHVVRYYVRIGLIHPNHRHENGYRLFDKSEVARLGFTRAAKHLGFTLNEIRQIMARADSGSSPCPDVRALMRERIVQNRARLDAMLTQQARMEAALAAWEEMPDRVPDKGNVCHLIESFTPEEASQPPSHLRRRHPDPTRQGGAPKCLGGQAQDPHTCRAGERRRRKDPGAGVEGYRWHPAGVGQRGQGHSLCALSGYQDRLPSAGMCAGGGRISSRCRPLGQIQVRLVPEPGSHRQGERGSTAIGML
jgi:DNA-binding transcriptional MerR regulator